MGLAEILAKKKAMQEHVNTVEKAIIAESPIPDPVPTPTVEAPVANKPMSFAEKMALKKKLEVEKAAPAVEAVSPIAALSPEEKTAQHVAAASSGPLSFAERMKLKKESIQAAQKAEPPKLEIDPARIPANPEEAQSFVDIVSRIHELQGLLEDDLKEGMSALKDAIKKNPSAADLLLDEELGLMVTALRRMRGLTVVAAEKEQKPSTKKPKTKDVQLTAEQLEAAWAEL